MNIVFAKSAWYGCVVRTRTESRWLRVGAAEGVDHVDVARLEVRDDLRAQAVEMLLRDLGVRVAPPDPLLGAGLAHDELVLRRAAGEAAGVDDERPVLGEHRLAPVERGRVELRRRRVAEHASSGAQSVDGEAVFRPVGDRQRAPPRDSVPVSDGSRRREQPALCPAGGDGHSGRRQAGEGEVHARAMSVLYDRAMTPAAH